MKGDIEVGDTIIIAEKAFEVTAVGDEAQKTFKELGHAILILQVEMYQIYQDISC